PVDDSGAHRPRRVEPQEMLPVEEAAHPQVSEPRELALRLAAEDARAKRPLDVGLRLADAHGEPRPLRELAVDGDDERVPLAVARKIRQHLPNGAGRGFDLDFRPNLHWGASERSPLGRSEERRVGKEGRYRWAADD